MKRWATLLLAIITAAGLSGCVKQVASTGAGAGASVVRSTVTDLAGRSIEVPSQVSKVVAIGPGALRLVCYAGAADKMVGIEDFELKKPIQRPYLLANPSILDLPVIGAGGPDSVPDAERLLEVAPDVVFVAQLADKTSAEELQETTGIPVVVLSYGETGTFDDQLFASLDLVGTVLNSSDRASEVSALIKSTMADLESRTAGIDNADRPTAYIGALGFKGTHGIESSSPMYPPFAAIGANNVAGDLTPKGNVMIDKEKLVDWDPRYIFLDRGGLSLVKEDVAKNRALYESLSAVKDKHVYTQIPFNNYSTNIETALANAYYAGAIMYPDRFSDVDPTAKLDGLSTAMLGKPMYETLSQTYKGGFENVDLLKVK